MKRCYNCKTEVLFEDVQFCEHCGVDLKAAPFTAEEREFEVTERSDDKEELYGVNSLRPASDDLGVQTSAELVQSLADDTAGINMSVVAPDASDQASGQTGTQTSNGIKHLSSNEVKKIESQMYDSPSYLSDREKHALIKKMTESGKVPSAKGFGNQSDLPRPGMAKRGRGIAYFVKNFVQIQGEISLHEDEELVINDRVFVLRKKPLTPKAVISVAGAVLAILAFVFIPILVRDAHVGQGEIVGLVLDSSRQPYIAGATVRLVESGTKYTTDAQGFFRTGHISPGTHQLEYLVGDRVLATDFATVIAGDVTTIALLPSGAVEGTYSSADDAQVAENSTGSTDQTNELQTPSVSQPQAVSAPNYGKVTLSANVEGAKLQIDGAPLGAGNLTYSRIKPGSHSYTVAKDGYQSVTGLLTVRPGATEVLAVTLAGDEHLTRTTPSPVTTEPAFAALKAGDVETAIAGFTSAIEQKPNYAEAYVGRGDAQMLSHNKLAAHDDYVRGAEIYRISGSYGDALTAYNKALTADGKSVTALLGRGNLYLDRHEEIAAIADYESVLSIDKKNSTALIGIGEARFAQGNYQQAIKYFKDAKSAEPNNPVVYQYLMLCYFGNDDLKNVRKSYDKFKETATQEQLARLHADKEYGAVLRVVQTGE